MGLCPAQSPVGRRLAKLEQLTALAGAAKFVSRLDSGVGYGGYALLFSHTPGSGAGPIAVCHCGTVLQRGAYGAFPGSPEPGGLIP